MAALYRWAEAGLAHQTITSPLTRRAPGNVPYLVDNLWEWRRAESFPSRRHAVYASPSPALAKLAGGAVNGEAYQVRVDPANLRICQAKLQDVRFHADVKALPRRLTTMLGFEWFGEPAAVKQDIALLWTPCLSAAEVEVLFTQTRLAPLRQALWDAVTFWQDVQPVDLAQPLPYPEGEIFFEVARYTLMPG